MLGTGIDIVRVDRIEKAVRRHGHRFLRRLFTPRELGDAGEGRSAAGRLAARFSGKEAVLKAIGCGLSGCSFREIEIAREESGRPTVKLSGKLLEIAREKGVSEVLISLSHEKDFAVAQATALGGGEE